MIDRITPEQLERILHEARYGLEPDQIERLRVAYEQAEARGAHVRSSLGDELIRTAGERDNAVAAYGQAKSERDTAQASEARLREALERIANLDSIVRDEDGPMIVMRDEQMREIARAALQRDGDAA